MIKKSLIYLSIAFVNLIVLTALLAIWTDKLELIFNDFVRPIEFLKIIVFTILSLLGMRILIYFLRKKNNIELRTKLKLATFLTFLISSYLYIDYSIKCFNNIVVNRQFRQQIADKIKPANQLANGTKADNLSISEYRLIAKINSFPKLPDESTSIGYIYEYDGFLPDYSFTLTYDIPKKIEIETINYSKEDFTKNQTYEIVGNSKRVKYNEEEH